MIENNRASSELLHENAYTNNTFSLPETERAIRATLENSYNYLKNVQNSYVSVARFNLNESDIYFDIYGNPCISLDKDFIDVTKRKPYKLSNFYNKYVGVDVLMQNPDIFWFIPVVMIDNKSIFSFKIKSCLDGHTDIMFTHIDRIQTFQKKYHSITVMFLKNTYLHQFTTNKHIVMKYDWKIPAKLSNLDKDRGHGISFFMMRDTTEADGTNFFVANINEKSELVLDAEDDLIYDFLINHREVEFTIVSPDNLFELEGVKRIHNRLDNNRQSCTFVIEEDEWKHYKMPIPTTNLLIFRRNKITGALTYENNKEVILHYPNIYEIMCDDVDIDIYDFKIYYLYKSAGEFLRYRDDFRYIHRYMARKLETDYEGAINKLLYKGTDDEFLQKYFFDTFNYEDASYLYNHSDFFGTVKPYDFDYKTSKMREFLVKNPYTFIPYGKRVGMPFMSYHLDVRTIDLSKRERMDTTTEALSFTDYFYFAEPFYVFCFGNEANPYLDLRFFVDGIYCDSTLQIHVNDMEYIYIPKSLIKEDTRITIERFESYTYEKKIRFEDKETPVTLKFRKKEFIKPTLYDLFITDEKWVHMDRSKFRIYALINTAEYDVSDVLASMGSTEDIEVLIRDEIIHEDPETGEIYILLEDIIEELVEDEDIDYAVELGTHDIRYYNYHKTRIPVRYMELNKLKIFCKEPEYLNRDLHFMINKVPFISYKQMDHRSLPKFKIFGGNIPWKQAKSYVRCFLNGRYQPMEFDIIAGRGIETYIVPRCYLDKGDVLTIDITPYSYELEYYNEFIPENFRIHLDGLLTKPFDHNYYDVYLNGRKLDDHNIRMITPNVIQLFNVPSRRNLRIIRRDRDFEFYSFGTIWHVPLDDLLGSPDLSEEDKEDIVFDIIHERIPDGVEKGKDEEWDNEYLDYIPPEIFHRYRFYVDIVLPEGVAKPNSFFVDKDLVRTAYGDIWETYSNKNNRVVLRPNIGWKDAVIVLMLGKNYADKTPVDASHNQVDSLLNALGDSDLLREMADGSIIGALREIVAKTGGIRFRLDPISGILSAVVETDD